MEYLSVKTLDKYQHYKDRNMVWFKWRIDCLQDYEFSNLKSGQKWLFLGLICLACKTDNKIPFDLEWIKDQLRYEKSSIKSDIDILIDSKMIALCYQRAIPIREDKKREEKIRREKEPPPKENSRFQKPSIKEVEEYAKSIGFILSGDQFCSFYEAKGWLIGKSPMKDWKACVRTWQKRGGDNHGRSRGDNTAGTVDTSKYDKAGLPS